MSTPTNGPAPPRITPARIRAILRAAAAGGAREADPAYARLRALLDLLARGTLAEAVARKRAAVERARRVFGSLPVPPPPDFGQAELAFLEGVRPDEARAVLASLDILEPHFGESVHFVRVRHSRGCAARAPARADEDDERVRDPSRPELTPERVRELLDLLPRIHEREPGIGRFLFRPALPGEDGKSARRLLGRRPAAVVAELAGDVHAFARDVFWLHLIAFRVRGGDSIDAHLPRARALSDPEAWRPLRAKRRELLAGEVAGVVKLLGRVGPREEAAVRAVADEAREMFFRYRRIG